MDTEPALLPAQRVACVRNVHNHLQVVLSDQDYCDDAILTTAANSALALNVTVPDGVEATARDGNLTLTGAVEYGRQRNIAELAGAGLVGVRNVKDDIDISYDADPVDATWLVQDALDRNALVDDDSDHRLTRPSRAEGCMTAHRNAGTPPDARADRTPLHGGRRRPAVRWIAHGQPRPAVGSRRWPGPH
jgi:hypothetical protein